MFTKFMNLLFITRKVDRGDPRAGFVHSWINVMNAELRRQEVGVQQKNNWSLRSFRHTPAPGRPPDARRFATPSREGTIEKIPSLEGVEVISNSSLFVLCQEKGDTSGLDDGIEVFSMKKERSYGRLWQWWEIQKVLWKNRDRLDVVFVHMMPMYAIAAGIFCKIFGKPLYLWYVHKSVDWRLRLTQLFVKGYFTASKESFRMKTRKQVCVVGHGIDVNKFKMQNAKFKIKEDNSIKLLTVGRISPVKNIHVMIDVVKALVTRGKDATLTIVGGPALERDRAYRKQLQEYSHDFEHQIKFAGSKTQVELVEYYQSADIFLNFSETGSLDKSVLEAMACGCPVLTSNEAFYEELKEFPQFFMKGGEYDQSFVTAAAERLIDLSKLNSEEERYQRGLALRERVVVGHHSLTNLMKRVVNIIFRAV